MSQDVPGGGDAGASADQQPPSVQRTGAGAGTAMEAMLKKRRMQSREPDPGAPAPDAPPPTAPGGATPKE